MAENDIKVLKETAESAKAAAHAISSATESLSEQLTVVQALNEIYEKFANVKTTPVFTDMSKALKDLAPEFEKLTKDTQSSSKELKELAKDIEEIDTTIKSLTDKMKDLSKTFNAKDAFATKSFDDMADSILSTKVNLDQTVPSAKNVASNLALMGAGAVTAGLGVNALSNSTIKLGKNSSLVSGAFKGLGSMFKIFGTTAGGAALGAVQGLISAFQGSFSIGSMATNLFSSVVEWSFKLGAAILAIPVNFLGIAFVTTRLS